MGFAPGGAADVAVRMVADGLSERLGQSVVIDNRPGAGTNIATEAVVRAPADGYTIGLVTPANAVNATLYDKLPFDFLRDIAPVAGTYAVPKTDHFVMAPFPGQPMALGTVAFFRARITMSLPISQLKIPCIAAVSVVSLLLAQVAPSNAETVADFYRGKTINFYIGFSAGGGYDLWARFVARHLGAHIPGKPTILVRNMPGAGSRTAAHFVYSRVPKDGLSLEASEQALALEQALGDDGIKFDVANFNWIGSPNSDNKTVTTWHKSGIVTLEDAKKREVTMGATGNTTSTQYVRAMNALLGTRFKPVMGYPGGNEINLAMERGEIDGRGSASWATWKTKTDWLRDHKLNFLVQVGLTRDEDLPLVPLLVEVTNNPEHRAMLRLLSAPSAIGHPIVTSPGVPPERVRALRAAFDATMRDPVLLKEARDRNLDISPVTGEQLEKIVSEILSAPQPIRARLTTILGKHEKDRKKD